MNKIRLLLIEDNRLLRDGIVGILKAHRDIDIVGTSGNSENSIIKLHELKPDIILLDLGLQNQNSLHFVDHVKKEFSQAHVIVMDIAHSQSDILQFIKARVSGFILKDATADDFLKTIRSVAHGKKVLPSLLISSLFSEIALYQVNGSNGQASKIPESVLITRREQEVMNLICDGMTNKEIAQHLHLSAFTIKSHVHNILEKLAIHTRIQIANYAHASRKNQISENVNLLKNK